MVREDLARLAHAPLYLRMPDLPAQGLAPGQRILVDLRETDTLELSASARFVSLATTSEESPLEAVESLDEALEEALAQGPSDETQAGLHSRPDAPAGSAEAAEVSSSQDPPPQDSPQQDT